MLSDLLLPLGDSGLARALQASDTLYASVNAAHILGLSLLLGAILPFDLRLLGLFRTVPLAPLATVLRSVAMVGLLLAMLTGAMLFAVNPKDYSANPAFLLKLVLLLAAMANIVVVERSRAFRAALAGAVPAPALRLSAALSAGLWIAILFCGRWIGFL